MTNRAVVDRDMESVPRFLALSNQVQHGVSALPATHWVMALILLISAVLRTQQISTVGVSFDESFCQRIVEFPWQEFFYRLGLDTHPPLYYVTLKLWTQCFGNSVVAGRSLSALFGLLSVLGIYVFVREAYQDTNSTRTKFEEADLPAVVAASLMALAPLQVFWALQIRMYSLSMATTLWSSYFLVRALRRVSQPWLNWSAYTVLATMLLYSHTFGMFILLAQLSYASICTLGAGKHRGGFSHVLLSAGCIVIAWLPWLPTFAQQGNRVRQHFYLPQPSFELLGTTMHEVWAGVGVPHSAVVGLWIVQFSILVLLALVVGRRPFDALVAMSAVIPVAAAFLISTVSRPIITARYFLFSQVFVIIAVSLVVCRTKRLLRSCLIGVAVCGMSAITQAHYSWREGISHLPGTRAAMARLEMSRGQEPLIVCNPMFYSSVLTYIHDRRNVYNFLPASGFPFYQGTPLMRESDYVDSAWIGKYSGEYLWTLDTDHYGRVPLPFSWKLVAEEAFPEWVDGMTLRLYSRSRDVSRRQ